MSKLLRARAADTGYIRARAEEIRNKKFLFEFYMFLLLKI